VEIAAKLVAQADAKPLEWSCAGGKGAGEKARGHAPADWILVPVYVAVTMMMFSFSFLLVTFI